MHRGGEIPCEDGWEALLQGKELADLLQTTQKQENAILNRVFMLHQNSPVKVLTYSVIMHLMGITKHLGGIK